MKWRLSSWLSIEILPVHDGEYDVKQDDGSVVPAEYRGGSWRGDRTRFVEWRGQELITSERELLRARRVVGRYKDLDTATHLKAVAASLFLARHRVSIGRGRTAFKYYLIAHRIDGSALAKEDESWLEQYVMRRRSKLSAIEARVDDFFSKRGEPKLKFVVTNAALLS